MIRMYFWDQYDMLERLCLACAELLVYSRKHLSRCPYQEGKTQCATCPTPCYKPAKKEKIREVMRYADPRMTYRHQILALYHLIDGKRKVPIKPVRCEE